jgi:hypothetical protein
MEVCDQNLVGLEPVDTLKQLWLQETTVEEVFPWKEYRLHGKPQSLKAFLDLFLLENGEYDKNRAAFFIWSWRLVEKRVPAAFHEEVLQVTLSSDKRCRGRLSVFSSTVEQAMPCLEFLFGIRDSHFEVLGLSYHVPGEDAGGHHLCPLTTHCLEKLLLQMKKNRENTFHIMAEWNKHQVDLLQLSRRIHLFCGRSPGTLESHQAVPMRKSSFRRQNLIKVSGREQKLENSSRL